MNLHVNSNLALELPPDLARRTPAPKTKIDPRAELAAQFIPSGARVLELERRRRCRRLLPNGCSYSGRDRVASERQRRPAI